jgi:diguanylate cyclase (GGDEF)-like protein
MQVELERAEAEAEMLRERLADAEALADRDPLIPVLNRRAFLDALQRTTSYVERYGGEAAVLYLDLDDFKQVNDGFGHPAGDAVLKAFGRLLLENVRETDTVGRIGGDEFAIILVQVSKEEARRKAQALADVIATATCTYEGIEHRISASIGLHVIARAEAAEAALARADEAMYAVKKSAKKKAKVSS